MTGRTLTLGPGQRAELGLYADGEPKRFADARRPDGVRRPTNLIRRGLLDSARSTNGPGYYRITSAGRAALATEVRTGTVRASELRGRGSWDVSAILAENDVYPRDEEHRYRIYARTGADLRVLACAGSPEALGVALVKLDRDEEEQGARLVDLGAIGVLDAVAGRWIIMPWHRPDPARTVAR